MTFASAFDGVGGESGLLAGNFFGIIRVCVIASFVMKFGPGTFREFEMVGQ